MTGESFSFHPVIQGGNRGSPLENPHREGKALEVAYLPLQVQ